MRPIAAITVGLFMLLPATAAADGLPAVGIDATPLSAPGGDVAYVTKAGKHATHVVERARYGGVLRQRRIEGVFSLPAVAYDGSPAGISADGRTLVLISPRTRYPRRRTTFAVLDTKRLTVRRQIGLKGDFSFDAIAPNGGLMYLVKYDPRAYGEYEVRAYDLRAQRLLAEPIVDPREPDEEMYGVPVTRASSADGRWAYTLYDKPHHPFVHALDTSGRTAVCIDLDGVRNGWGATLELRGPTLEVVGGAGRVLASIDTQTHRLIETAAPLAKAGGKEAGAAEDGGSAWLRVALPAAAALLLLLLIVRIRRRSVSAAEVRGL
ncbi:MAG: hypothetical protein QOE69_14 [Thermoleophilaceae bacterium]|jgi:hypothetical protein|nr:hypothetical protein [Thermoleophilaceae bacterium]